MTVPEAVNGSELDANLLPVRVGGARPPLFLIAAPGVNALGYVAIARLLPPDQPAYIVQPKKRGRRFPEEGIGPGGRDEYPIVAQEYLASIRTVQPHGPYQLTGACDGGLIAFEMVRLLEAQGEVVSMLAQLDTWPLENTSIYPLVLMKIMARGWLLRTPEQRRGFVRRKANEAAQQSAARLHVRPPVPALQKEAERQAIWRAKLWPGRRFVAPVVKAPIVVLRVEKQPFWRVPDDALGWRGRTTGLVTVHILPGNHATWSRSPNVEVYSPVLAAFLAPAPAPLGQEARPMRAPKASPRLASAPLPNGAGGVPSATAGHVHEQERQNGQNGQNGRANTWRGRIEEAVAAKVQRGKAALDTLLVRAADDVKR